MKTSLSRWLESVMAGGFVITMVKMGVGLLKVKRMPPWSDKKRAQSSPSDTKNAVGEWTGERVLIFSKVTPKTLIDCDNAFDSLCPHKCFPNLKN